MSWCYSWTDPTLNEERRRFYELLPPTSVDETASAIESQP